MKENHYVVRGADICCSCGSHARKLNLPASHGSYVNGKPMMNERDCRPEENISCFGICSSDKNESGETVYLVTEDGAQIQGKPCLPVLLGEVWTKAKPTVQVGGAAALTTDSELYCKLGGIIRVLNHGQQD